MEQNSSQIGHPLAIVHDWLNVYGGAERLLAGILDVYPQAHLHALIHNPAAFVDTPLLGRLVTTSYLQRVPGIRRIFRSLLPLMPMAVASFDLERFPVVLSVSHAVAHAARTNQEQTHIAYICTPMRYAWHLREDYLGLYGLNRPVVGTFARWLLGLMRHWDKKAAQRPGYLLAISEWSRQRVQASWGRDAKVIYPPVDVKRFRPSENRDDFYLLVSRLVPYKMVVTIIQAFNRLKKSLIVIGDGQEYGRAVHAAGPTVQVLGYQPDAVVVDLMNRARAYIHMALEDFGMAMVEAQAAGCPVIAYRQGGASEIVVDGKTGLLYDSQSVESLAETVLEFEKQKQPFDKAAMVSNAERFSKERFYAEFSAFMHSVNVKKTDF